MRSSISTSDTRPVLNVDQSVTGRRWTRRGPVDDAVVDGITPVTDGNAILARLLAARGVTPQTAADTVRPTLRAWMPDPSSLRDMGAAAALLADAVQTSATVGLFGDYDVDGAASSALLARWLQALGARPIVHIPDRLTEGYGPNNPAIDGLAGQGIDLLVTLDCGATSTEALDYATSLGLPVLVLDHHQMSGLGPSVDALVNPNRPDDTSGLGDLCAAGVTFMTLVAANRELRNRGVEQADLPDLLRMTDLVALATVADIVPLTGLNRAFVVTGTQVADQRSNLGLEALAKAARLSGSIRPSHFGFVLGPRINAGGRIGDAGMGARLLMSDDPSEAAHLAAELDTLNSQRQAIEAEAVAAAIAQAELEQDDNAAIIVRDDTWHQGVVGLIAARLKERFHRPAFAFTLAQDGAWTGSARSVPGIDVGQCVHGLVAKGLAVKGGGHAMAAGLSIADQKWNEAAEALQHQIADQARSLSGDRALDLDTVLTSTGASLDFVRSIEALAPYGTGFPEPVFALASHRVTYAGLVGTNHVKVTLSDGQGQSGGLQAIAFRAAETPLGEALMAARGGDPIHVAGTLSINAWQGRESPQLRIIDIAKP